MYYTYILKCNDGTYYVGCTNDLDRRLYAHNTLKSGAHYTKIRRPVHFVHTIMCSTYGEARKIEAEWKRFTRIEKERLFL